MTRRDLWLLLLASLVVALPLFLTPPGAPRDFSGTDASATALAERLDPSYRPWLAPSFTPPGAEVESLLFSLQAALGAGFLGYVLGLSRGRSQPRTSPHARD